MSDEVIINIKNKFDKFNKYNWDNPNLIVDMSKIKNLNITIINFLDSLNKTLNHSIKEIKKKKVKNNILNSYNENLDLITRNLVGELLKEPRFLGNKKKIIQKRKEFIKKNIHKLKTELEIANNFKNFIEMELNIKIS